MDVILRDNPQYNMIAVQDTDALVVFDAQETRETIAYVTERLRY